ncbi:MAG TPA: glycosyl hydrolase [Candidatus Aquilonibacter sp.]|nr:glycosyl hydrolase [Candidatus Aquilonibacter sp.]
MKVPPRWFWRIGLIALCASLWMSIAATSPLLLHPPRTAVSREFFGLHIHRAFSTTPWPPVPFGSWRLWGSYVRWPQVEPERNQWQWDILDREVELGEQHHVDLLLPLGDTPEWASATPDHDSNGPSQCDVADLQDWRTVIRTEAMRYKGRIRYYEIWNEPNLPRLSQTCSPEKLLILAREAYTTLKQVDPNIRVISPSPVNGNGLDWLDRYLELGGGKYADIIGYHFYVTTRPESMLNLILPAKEIMRKHGVDDKPLWNTEAGWIKRLTGRIDLVQQAPGWAARAYILNWAAGVERFYWYAWDDDGGDSVPFTEEDETTITGSARAYAEIQKWLVGATMQSCERDANGTWVSQLTRESGRSAWILWNEDHSSKFDVPKAWHVERETRLSGEQSAWSSSQVDLSELPIMLEGPAAHPSSQK